MKVNCFILKKFVWNGSKGIKAKRRHFLLLEVLIAFVLVLICAFPLLTSHAFIATKEKEYLREVQIDRLVNLLLVHLVEQLYTHKYEWVDLQKGISETLTEDQWNALGFPRHLPYDVKYELKFDPNRQTKEKNGHTKHILVATIIFSPHERKQSDLVFSYDLFVDKKVPMGAETPIEKLEREKREKASTKEPSDGS